MAGQMIKRANDRFQDVLTDFVASEPMAELQSGKVGIEEYKSYLKQVYFYVRENPQIQAMSTAYFRGHQRSMVKSFFRHAASETGHEFLALNDFETLGGDATLVPYQNPLSATTALTSYAYYQIYNLNPLGVLGYIYFLEFLPTKAGDIVTGALKESGVGENALTYMREHMEVDIAHNRLMEKYIEELVVSDEELDTMTYAMKTTGYLYAQMIGASIEDARNPAQPTWNWVELKADGKTPHDGALRVA